MPNAKSEQHLISKWFHRNNRRNQRSFMWMSILVRICFNYTDNLHIPYANGSHCKWECHLELYVISLFSSTSAVSRFQNGQKVSSHQNHLSSKCHSESWITHFFHHSTHTIFGWRINVLAIHPLFLSFSLSIQHVHKCNIFRRYRFFGLGRSANAAVYVCRNILRRKPSLTKFQVAFGLDAKYQRDAINLSNTLRADYAGRGRHFICNVCGHFFTIFTLFPSIQFQIIQSLFRSFCADKHGRCMYGRFM